MSFSQQVFIGCLCARLCSSCTRQSSKQDRQNYPIGTYIPITQIQNIAIKEKRNPNNSNLTYTQRYQTAICTFFIEEEFPGEINKLSKFGRHILKLLKYLNTVSSITKHSKPVIKVLLKKTQPAIYYPIDSMK